MPTYVPKYNIVKEPIVKTRKEFGSSSVLGNRDITLGEVAEEALRGNITSYQDMVRISLGSYCFYSRAPTEPHCVLTVNGEQRYLKDTTEIRDFYSGLPEIERNCLNGSEIEKLLK